MKLHTDTYIEKHLKELKFIKPHPFDDHIQLTQMLHNNIDRLLSMLSYGRSNHFLFLNNLT